MDALVRAQGTPLCSTAVPRNLSSRMCLHRAKLSSLVTLVGSHVNIIISNGKAEPRPRSATSSSMRLGGLDRARNSADELDRFLLTNAFAPKWIRARKTTTCLHVIKVWYRSQPQFIIPVMSELIDFVPLINAGSLSHPVWRLGNCKYGQIMLTNSDRKWNQLTHNVSLVPSRSQPRAISPSVQRPEAGRTS